MNLRQIATRALYSTRLARRQPSDLAYWDERAELLGRRSVIDIRHTEAEYARVTHDQIARLEPIIESTFAEAATVLDLGCGPGRFVTTLVAGGRTVVAVDPVGALLAVAPRQDRTSYAQATTARLPFRDSTMDGVFCCLVLGALGDRELAATAREIRRVLKPHGRLVVVENTTKGLGSRHYAFRSIRTYRRRFRPERLQVVGTYQDLGETISVLVGIGR